MTAVPHPTYDNPTIQEAICEIQFRLKEGLSWNPAWYGEFFKSVLDQFPTFQPVSLPILVNVSNTPPTNPAFAVPQMMRYHHASRNLLLQLSENRLLVNVLPNYPGWVQVLEDIRYAWDQLCVVVTPAIATRIGIRYINRIERRSDGETADRWFMPNQYLPIGLLQSQPGFAGRIVVTVGRQEQIGVTFGDQPSEAGGYGVFILDIDRSVEGELNTDTSIILEEASRLHEDVWQVFRSAVNERLERLLRGDLP